MSLGLPGSKFCVFILTTPQRFLDKLLVFCVCLHVRVPVTPVPELWPNAKSFCQAPDHAQVSSANPTLPLVLRNVFARYVGTMA